MKLKATKAGALVTPPTPAPAPEPSSGSPVGKARLKRKTD